ncbi:MAG: S41 family peptidase [Bacteroides sp.]|nr:S41 family peptidase [Bacteroidales bacterium]MBD5302668.1 S41 family peptidase [Bacteroides sp.]MBD5304944.1 S41 family peptidase [Bacteroides sp.]MBD5347673.1 S41 family peptidase [Bacteroides sp.]
MKKILYFVICCGLAATIFADNNIMPPAQKLRWAETAIADLYVDTVNEDQLVETAIKSMLEELDPHSSYTTAEETREMNEPLNGNFSGIGITFNMNKDTLYVISTVAGGPSERAGILAGDRIITVNDTSIAGVKMKNSDIMKRLRGPKGTRVDVRVLRHSSGKNDSIDFRLTRADIPIYSIDAAYMADPTTGYIRVNRFAAETNNEFIEAVEKLKKQGMTGLILDLVDNGGGYLNAAVDILGELLEPGNTAVYTEGRQSPIHYFEAHPKSRTPLFNKGRLVVMVNQNSASAAEITSGAIQDWDRGVIVGRRTFGKGLVQRPIPFPDGSMIRLTVAHYYTPSGRDIQKPYTKGDASGYRHDILDRLNSGELMHADSIKYIDSLKVSTLKLGREIYGGGGISPDLFVPLDTTAFTNYYRDVIAKGALNQFVIKYVDTHRKEIKKLYGNDRKFIDGFKVTDEMLADLYETAKAEGVEPNEEEAARSRQLFEMQIKALIGRDIYDQATYFKVYNLYDPIFKEALRIVNSPDYDSILSKKN